MQSSPPQLIQDRGNLNGHPKYIFIMKQNMERMTQNMLSNSLYKFKAVGQSYLGNYKFNDNDKITLEPEPINPHDSNAIKILVNNVCVAYVGREFNEKLLDLLQTRPNGQLNLIKNYPNSAELSFSY